MRQTARRIGAWPRHRKGKEIQVKAAVLASAAMAMLAMGLPPSSAAAADREFTTILLERVVDRTPDQVWARIGPYCSISQWLGAPCQITQGNGVSVGTNRRLRGTTDEVMVAATSHSYSYAQPASAIFYHGTLAVEPMDRGRKSKIVYTLFYDVSPLTTVQARQADRRQRTARFGAALDKMKEMAEAP
jgi:uncharacterized protein YndB with AHSA1/START domain